MCWCAVQNCILHFHNSIEFIKKYEHSKLLQQFTLDNSSAWGTPYDRKF